MTKDKMLTDGWNKLSFVWAIDVVLIEELNEFRFN